MVITLRRGQGPCDHKIIVGTTDHQVRGEVITLRRGQ
ncbi:hypothetical protein A2U01_0077348, partial [Trifolium medium]|nr:hypothetical protein [Trifolium medium]